jgi:hypothetical protein
MIKDNILNCKFSRTLSALLEIILALNVIKTIGRINLEEIKNFKMYSVFNI